MHTMDFFYLDLHKFYDKVYLGDRFRAQFMKKCCHTFILLVASTR